MTDISLKLESLKLSSPKERIRLIVTPLARFGCEHSNIRGLTSAQLLDSLEAGKVCVTRGQGSKIDVNIVLKKLYLHRTSGKALAEELGRSVHQAPWWAQLPISPSLELPESNPSQNAELGFSIKISDTLPDLSTDGVPDPSICPSEDLHVPEAVPTIKLQGMTLIFTFEHIQERALPVLAKPCSTNDEMLLEDFPDDSKRAFEEIINFNQFCFPLSQPEIRFSSNYSQEPEPSLESLFFEDEDAVDDIPLLYHTYHDSTPSLTSQASTPFQSQENIQPYQPPQTLPLSDCHQGHRLDIVVARRLTDVALRTLIGGRQTKHVPSIRIGKPRPTYPLSTIMPLLWSPGFQTIMAQRSRFLTTISNAMTHLTQTVQSPSLQQKLARIQTMSSAIQPSSLTQTVQAQLFRLMHASLHDPMSARRLQPAKVDAASADSKGEDVDDEMIMDIPRQLSGEVHHKDESHDAAADFAEPDFEDMFEEELLSDNEIDMLFDLEIMRQHPMKDTRGSCSMLLQSEAGCSMLLEDENGGDERMDGILEEQHFWQHGIRPRSDVEDGRSEMMMLDAAPEMSDESSIYTTNERMLI